jgi:serine phosphatase RsbU (regulator of sigma subunit)/ligand-binding sensor domain-containing protein
MRFLLTAILFSLSFNGFSQEVIFPVKNYTTKEYGRDFNPANFSVLQDPRGIIYAANGFKLLEYDGRSWNSYPINKETWILSLAADKSGIIYAGSQGEFGRFIPDNAGKLTYSSISDSLSIEDLDFTNVWKVIPFQGGVAFQSEEKLFIFADGKIKAIKPESTFHTSFEVNGTLYIRERGKGLLKWNNGSLVHIAGSEIFDNTGIFMMISFGRGSREILTGTRGKGFWLFDPGKPASFRKFQLKDDELLEKSEITGGILTNNGLFAIGTRLGGIFLIDSAGATVCVMNEKNGLSDNEIRQVMSDNDGNLWVATNNGISTIEISSPLSLYSERSGITGSITSVIRFKDQLYAGTSNGLFIERGRDYSGAAFEPYSEAISNVRCLAEAGGFLLAGTDDGLYDCSAKTPRRISDDASYDLYFSPKLNLLFSGGSKGLDFYRIKGSLKKMQMPDKIKEDIIGITGDENGRNDTITIWAGLRYNGAARIIITPDLSFSTEYFNSADGLPGGSINPFATDSHVVFGTSSGLFRFIDEKEVRKNLPDSLKGKKEFIKGYFSGFRFADEESKPVSSLYNESSRVWVCSDNKAGFFDKSQNMKLVSQPFAGLDVGRINKFYPDKDGICWIGTSDGLIRYDGNSAKKYDRGFSCLIRKVNLLDNDSTVFSGSFYNPERGIILNQPAESKPVLLFTGNSIRIEFSAPFYEYKDKISYSFQLNDSKWSQWHSEGYQDFTNLREGEYIFRVKAMNVYGRESSVSEYGFRILPPWYRSVLAFILYLFSGIVLIWLIVRANSYRLKMENIRLEGIVAERTSEVVRQKEEIQDKNTTLEHQNKEIEDSIRYASRIQTAVIPSENFCLELFPASFIFFRPLNIVSGDFYWFSRVGQKIVFTAADCTGHGVPGAFMSMLGVAFLNEIVEKDQVTEPDLILNQLRLKVIEALQHKGTSEARDGMDISLICIDPDEKTLKYAGAYNPLVMIRNNEITTIEGDKMPVGYYERMDRFTKHELSIQPGDVFYLASDGYEDQFGGPDGKKFKAKKFRQMLLEIHQLPMSEQKEIIEKRFAEWKGELKQIDDIVVAGIKIG